MALPANFQRSTRSRAASSSDRDELAVGQLAGRYLLIRKIGEGGMGIVFEALDPELDRRVALKFFHPPSSRAGDTKQSRDTARQRLLQEARSMAAVDHPHVVTVYDVGLHDGRVFVAMELIRGRGLTDWIRSEQPHWRTILSVLTAAGRGLAAVHANGLVHRDFKPDNVLVADGGSTAYVLDFGLARRDSGCVELRSAEVSTNRNHDDRTVATTLVAEHDGSIGPVATPSTIPSQGTRSESSGISGVVGTPSYMSPEQHRGAAVDWRSDLYGFCVTAFEALYGTRPFVADSLGRLARLKLRGPPMSAPSSAIPRAVFETLVRGLAPDPEDRPADFHELLDALAHDPRAGRRKAWTMALVLTVPVLFGLSVVERQWTAEAPCSERVARERTAATWSLARASAIRNAFAATGLGYARDTADRTVAGLDRRIAAWHDTYTRLCEGRYARESSPNADVQWACLDRRLDETAGLVRAFTDPTRERVDHAVRSVAALSPIDDCLDAERLTSLEPIPTDPELRVEVAALRGVLAKFQTLDASGDRNDAGPQLRAALDRALATGFLPVIGEAHERLGSHLSDRGRDAESLEHIQRAIEIAEATDHDPLAARALSSALFVQVYQRRNAVVARELIRHAETHISRVPQLPEVEAGFLHSVAPALGTIGDDEGAEASVRRAVELYENLLGAHHPTVAMLLQNHGVALAMLGRKREAIDRMVRAVELESNALGPHSPGLRLPLSNLGLMYLVRGEFESARRFAARAAEIHRAANIGPDEYARRAFQVHGMILAEVGQHRLARQEFESLLAAHRELHGHGSPRVLNAWWELANVFLATDDQAGLERTRDAVADLIDRHGGSEGRRGGLQVGPRLMALVADALGDEDTRDRYLARVGPPPRGRRNAGDLTIPRAFQLQVHSEWLRLGATAGMAEARWVLARFERENGRLNASTFGLLITAGRIALALGDPSGAFDWGRRALQVIDGVLTPDNPRRAWAHALMATAAHRRGDRKLAREHRERVARTCRPAEVTVPRRAGLIAHCES